MTDAQGSPVSQHKGVSVIICCFNSAGRIKATLKHLSLQKIDTSLQAELLLVDNRSTDNTAVVASDYWNSLGAPIPLKVIGEQQQGLSYARVRGLKEAKWDTVVFCDDDNWLNENFLTAAHTHFEENPDAAVMGGPIEPEFETSPPSWLESYYGFLALGRMEEEGDITAVRAFVPGAGMVIRKSRYEKLVKSGFEFTCSDRKGNKLSSGGDTELCYALVLAGGRVHNYNDLSVKHYVPAARTTWSYISRLVPAIAAASVILSLYKDRINGKVTTREELRNQLREKRGYVYNPLQWLHAKRNSEEGNKIGLGYRIGRAVMKQLSSLLGSSGRLNSIDEQLNRLTRIARNK